MNHLPRLPQAALGIYVTCAAAIMSGLLHVPDFALLTIGASLVAFCFICIAAARRYAPAVAVAGCYMLMASSAQDSLRFISNSHSHPVAAPSHLALCLITGLTLLAAQHLAQRLPLGQHPRKTQRPIRRDPN